MPCFESFYGTAVDVIGLRESSVRRVLDLGAGTGLLSAAVLARYPQAELVALDGAAEMLEHARERLSGWSVTTVVADLRERLPDGPFDAVVSALAIHHLEDPDKRGLIERVHEALRPGGVFVNAEHVSGPSPWLGDMYRLLWREACREAGASEGEIAAAQARMETDRCVDVATQLEWMQAAGLHDCDCFFKHLHFAVLAGWRAGGPHSRSLAPACARGYAGGMSETTLMPTEDDVMDALSNVIDPELGLDFVELGLIYGVEVAEGNVRVTFTLTTPGCPIGPQVNEQIEEFVGELDGVKAVESEMVFTPPWSPEMMSEDAKFALGY